MRRFLFLLLPLAFLGLGFTAYLAGKDRPAAPADAPAAPAAADTALPETSVYQLGSSWTDQQGRTVALEALRGRPQLVAMVFTRCGFACPRTVHDVKQLLARVPDAARAGLGVVLVSIDPARDTAAALAQFSQAHRLDPAQWTLLRGEEPDVRSLAAVLGVRYKDEGNGQFAHSNLVTLLDADGTIAYQLEGLGADPTGLLDALHRLPH